MLHLRLILLALLAAAACGQSDDVPAGPDAPVDGAAGVDALAIDAPPGTAVTVVDCAGATPIFDVVYTGDALTPRATTVETGQVVRFRALGNHTAWETSGRWSASGDSETCVRFDAPGEYGFYCYFHMGNPDETGTVTAL